MTASHSGDGSVAAGVALAADADAPLSYVFSDRLLTLNAPDPSMAEPFRAIAHQLIEARRDQGHRGVVVCGVSRGVGVTFLAANLAVAISQVGMSTLLVDSNLRHPGLQPMFGPEPAAKAGLSDLLSSRVARLDDVLRHEVLPNLNILFAGEFPAALHDALGTDRGRDVLEECMRNHDLVVVDAPAANASSDALALCSVLRYSIVVARKDLSYVDDVGTLVSEIEGSGAQVLGIVMNGE